MCTQRHLQSCYASWPVHTICWVAIIPRPVSTSGGVGMDVAIPVVIVFIYFWKHRIQNGRRAVSLISSFLFGPSSRFSFMQNCCSSEVTSTGDFSRNFDHDSFCSVLRLVGARSTFDLRLLFQLMEAEHFCVQRHYRKKVNNLKCSKQ